MRGHLRMDDPFLRHALRLTVTFAAAVALSWWLDLPHPYWLPMTVAWISKPAQSDTTTKVIARVAQGCGPGMHRGPYGGCLPNYGPRRYGPPRAYGPPRRLGPGCIMQQTPYGVRRICRY